MSGLGDASRVGDTASGGQGTLTDMGAGEYFQAGSHCQGGIRGGYLDKLGDTARGLWEGQTL